MRYRKCPTKCSGCGSERQHDVPNGLLAQFPENIQEVINKSPAKATRCSYCGCVYLYESAESRVLGEWNNGISGTNWYKTTYP